jgi:hypothetical protein
LRIPDFFIIGASKCGTTSLSRYLDEHPNVCFSLTKEPHFFSDDFPFQKLDADFGQYWRRNFSQFDERKHLRIGDGSGTYYISDVAIPNILRENPAAKFIYMVRSPVDMAHSWYYHIRFGGGEDVSFKEAWELQALRRCGERVPKSFKGEPRFLQYRAMASLGSRLKVITERVPAGQLMVVVFDDFVRNTKATYERVLAFLEIPTDNRTDFPRYNQNKVQRSKVLGRINASIPRGVSIAAHEVRSRIGLKHVPLNFVASLNAKNSELPQLTPCLRARLARELAPEVDLLERHLNRDLSAWRCGPGDAADAEIPERDNRSKRGRRAASPLR